MSGERIKPVCSVCGSSKVTSDAYAKWDVRTQDWELIDTLDNTDCEDCGGECSLKWVTA